MEEMKVLFKLSYAWQQRMESYGIPIDEAIVGLLERHHLDNTESCIIVLDDAEGNATEWRNRSYFEQMQHDESDVFTF